MSLWTLKLADSIGISYTDDIYADSKEDAFERYLAMYPGERAEGVRMIDAIETKEG